jgi:hypothetical protein
MVFLNTADSNVYELRRETGILRPIGFCAEICMRGLLLAARLAFVAMWVVGRRA